MHALRVLTAAGLITLAALALWFWPEPDTVPAAIPTIAAPANAPKPLLARIGEDAEVVLGKSPSTRLKEVAPTPTPTRAAYRASIAQRADDARHLAGDTDLQALAAELLARADAGDADAAKALADIYEACGTAQELLARREGYVPFLHGMMTVLGFNQTEIEVVSAALHQLQQRCAAFPARQLSMARSLVQDWRDRAGQLGHPAALLETIRPHGTDDSPEVIAWREQTRRAGIELLQQGDPMDLQVHSARLSQLSVYSRGAYLVAACTLLAGCMDDPRAYALQSMRAPTGIGVDLTLFELGQLSPRELLIAQGQSLEILRLWREGHLETILSDRSGAGGGGG
jgi:hypothetical protein